MADKYNRRVAAAQREVDNADIYYVSSFSKRFIKILDHNPMPKCRCLMPDVWRPGEVRFAPGEAPVFLF